MVQQKDFKHKFTTNPRMGYLEEHGMANALQCHMREWIPRLLSE